MAIVSVKTRDLRRVQLSFSAGASDEALAGALYTFTAQAVPAYNPTVESARYLNGRGVVPNSIVELVLDADLSPGVLYDLAVSAFTGESASTHAFTAVAPQWPGNRKMELWDFIPRINKEEDTTKHLERFIGVIQDQFDVFLTSVDNWTDIFDVDRASEPALDLLLQGLGNPFQISDLSEFDKRRLVRMLVEVYKFKGTDKGIQAAIRLFLGFESQINLYRQSGSLLGTVGQPRDKLDDTFVLGAGTSFDFALTVATTDAVGRDLTATEVSRIRSIVGVIKPAQSRMLEPILPGLVAPDAVQIVDNDTNVVITWRQTATVPTNWRVYYRRSVEGVSPFNSSGYVEVAGSATTATINTPIGTDPSTVYFFALVPFYLSRRGFRSENEVRNGLPAPDTVTVTAGVRNILIDWTPVADATSYLVYEQLSGTCTPVTATVVNEVLGGQTYFVDEGLLPGQSRSYCVVPRIGNAEGTYSASVTGTAL